jgi:hypothetical protein
MPKVIVPYPLNLMEDNRFMYQPYLSFERFSPKVKNIKNTFVAFSGFCLNNRGLIKECHHAYPQQYNYYQNEVSKYYYSARDNPENLITLDDENTYLAIHHPWFNYYHWICESIFRLWLVRKKLDNLILILPAYYKDADFIMGSLEPFKIKHFFFIPDGKSLIVKNLCLPQIKPICDSYNAGQLKQVRNFYVNYVFFEKRIPFKKIKRLYVSRELASRRKIINEMEVQQVLSKYDFTVFYPEKHGFLEQVAIFSQVQYLVGTHGSGLTNLLFMDKNTSLLELHKDKTNELDHPSPLFWYMAHSLGVNYYHQLCKTEGKEDYFEGDYIVDCELLEQNVKLMLNN